MGNKDPVPDAWDDDWESQIDQVTADVKQQQPQPAAPLTKAERLTQHTEANRKLWQSAQTPETFHFLEANSNTPAVATSFKPQVKVLSRKPIIAKRDPVTGMSQLTMDDDDESVQPKEAQLTPEETRAKQKKDMEEKQRRYDEARAKIFGESASSSRASSPGTTTPPRPDSRHQGQGRTRGRGGFRGNVDSRPSVNRQANPTQPAASSRELYDPNMSSSPRPDSANQRRIGDGEASPRRTPVRDEYQATRSPKGPDGSGRGGFGFARRGAGGA